MHKQAILEYLFIYLAKKKTKIFPTVKGGMKTGLRDYPLMYVIILIDHPK